MKRAFSLVEMVLSCALLSLATLVAFALFQFGNQAFRLGNLRNNLQGEARRVSGRLESDLRRADFTLTTVLNKGNLPAREVLSSSGQLVQRDAICVPGLSSWTAASSYDGVTGLPLWDQYHVYYATTEADGGRIIRQTVQPAGFPYTSAWAAFGATSLQNTPNLNTGPILATETLAQQVEEFHLAVGTAPNSFSVSLRFRGTGGRKPGTGKRLDESLQVQFQFRAENTP